MSPRSFLFLFQDTVVFSGRRFVRSPIGICGLAIVSCTSSYNSLAAQNTFPASGNAGIGTTSPAYALTVMGNISSPQGTNSERFGAASSASSTSSVAIGYGAHADYATSVSVGAYAVGTNAGSVQVGYLTGATTQGTAIGFLATASGAASSALGISAHATGGLATALGGGTLASGSGSIAMGYSNVASGAYSFAVGYGANVEAGSGMGLGAFSTVGPLHTNSVAIGYQAATTGAGQFVAGGTLYAINDIYFGKGVSNAAPVPVTINSNGASGTNVLGANLILSAGKATGNAAGGNLLFQTSNAGTSGTTSASSTTKMILTSTGAVGIGTGSPCATSPPTACLLSVNGGIQAHEVVVNTGWSDHVFDETYRLAPLTELASYVERNHHLPGIPSAVEVAEHGVSVGEMQAKLLEKIEELTLHMIDAEKRSWRMEDENARLRVTDEARGKNLREREYSRIAVSLTAPRDLLRLG